MSEGLALGKKRAKELGLNNSQSGGYYADDIHLLLGSANEAFGFKFGKCPELDWRTQNINRTIDQRHPECSHKALLIGIRPIKQKSREEKLESILRELLDNDTWNVDTQARAKAILNEKINE